MVLIRRRRRFRSRHEDDSPTPINMKIKIQNFGPISDGEFELKPLTIFVGPNNSGKSYAAMLIHSIVSSLSQGDSTFSRRYFLRRPYYELYLREENEITKNLKTLSKKNTFIVPSVLINKIARAYFEDSLKNKLPTEIARNFGSPLHELIQIGKKTFSISFSTNLIKANIVYRNGNFILKNIPKINLKIKVDKKLSSKINSIYSITEKDNLVHVSVNPSWAKDYLSIELPDIIFSQVFEHLSRISPAGSYYFPAARSGILQGHRAISASIIRNAPYGGIEPIQIPKMTGVISDFISTIIIMPGPKGPFSKLADNLEDEILHGRIKMSTQAKGAMSEIKYEYLNNDIPLHRTSSTVSELAPFTLYLKYIIGKSSLLIIEEPEAHLHPRNQRLFAKYLVRLVRQGLNIMVTTHSPYLLEQLSSFLLTSKIDPKMRIRKLGFDKDDYLEFDEVSPYVFSKTSKDGNKIKAIGKSNQDGISQEEFVRISEELYDENLKIQETSAKKKK